MDWTTEVAAPPEASQQGGNAAADDTKGEVPPLDDRMTSTCCGPIRRWYDINRCEWVFVVVSLLVLLLSLGFTIKDLKQLPCNCDDFMLEIVILITILMAMYHVIASVVRPHPSESAVFILSVLLLLSYSAISYVNDPNDTEDLVRLILNGAFQPFCIILSIYAHVKYSPYARYIHRINANERVQRRLHCYFTCRSLIVLNVQIRLSMVAFIAATPRFGYTLLDWIPVGTALGFSFVWVICGLWGMKAENRCMVVVFLICSLFHFGYDIFRLYEVFNTRLTKMYIIAASMCAGVGITLTVVTNALMIIIWQNFEKGVTELLYLSSRRVQGRTLLINEASPPDSCDTSGSA